jgi:hypothetical protein
VGAGGQGALHVGDRGEQGEAERHRRRRVGGLGCRLRDHDGDRLAHVAHAIHRERRDRRRGERPAVAAGERGGGGDRAEAGRGQIAPGEHGEHPGPGEGGGGVHAADVRVGEGGAHEGGVGRPRPVQIVGEAPASGQERAILATPPAGGPEAQRVRGAAQVR